MLSVAINVISLIVAFKGLLVRRGFNRQVKRQIFTRQVFFVLIRFLADITAIVKSYYAIVTVVKDLNMEYVMLYNQIRLANIYMESIKCLFYFMYLFVEPSFKKALYRTLLCRCRFRSRLLEDEQPINSFLFSQMNMELVCAILTGIRKSLVDTMGMKHSKESVKNQFKQVLRHKLTRLQIIQTDFFTNASVVELVHFQNM